MVLLKNDGILPLTSPPKAIAVVGPLADNTRVLEGNDNGTPSRATTALDGIRKHFATSEVTFVPGTHFLREPTPVPADLFTTPDGKPGLRAEYFKGVDLKDTPAVIRIDKNIDFNFIVAPVPGFCSGAFKCVSLSARWTGFMTPAESGAIALA
jgi:beta-glucosidase